MHTLATAYYSLKEALHKIYDEREASAVSHEVMGYITGMSKIDRLIFKDTQLSSEQLLKYEYISTQLLKSVPLQYALGEAWFMGQRYVVNSSVLIPRPETEELVEWIVFDYKQTIETISVLEVGTGSGCISVSLCKLLNNIKMVSCDISGAALQVAQENAKNIGADIDFRSLNFLNWEAIKWDEPYDVIVSNPPYIPMSVKDRLHSNVINNEPHIALFVPDDDPLVFYKAIASFGLTHLREGGSIYCELDADNALATKVMFEQCGYGFVDIKKDMHSNNRMLKAKK